MTADSIIVDTEVFEPVQVTEERLEGVLAAIGTSLFPGLTYYPFRPAIQSRWGARHPDGAIIAPGCRDWWVVEVELHSHDVNLHVIPQLEGLADGTYGWHAFDYLVRNAGLDPGDYVELDVWEPSFLLIADHVTPQLRGAASRFAFEILECEVYRSIMNRYAVTLTGRRPSRPRRELPGGWDVRLIEAFGVAVLEPLNGHLPKDVPEAIRIGSQYARARRTQNRAGLALPLRKDDVAEATGGLDHYRVTTDGRLVPTDP